MSGRKRREFIACVLVAASIPARAVVGKAERIESREGVPWVLPTCAASSPLAQELFEYDLQTTDIPQPCLEPERVLARSYGERLRPALETVLASCRPTASPAPSSPEEYLLARALRVLAHALPARWATEDLQKAAVDTSLPQNHREDILNLMALYAEPASKKEFLAYLRLRAPESYLERAASVVQRAVPLRKDLCQPVFGFTPGPGSREE